MLNNLVLNCTNNVFMQILFNLLNDCAYLKSSLVSVSTVFWFSSPQLSLWSVLWPAKTGNCEQVKRVNYWADTGERFSLGIGGTQNWAKRKGTLFRLPDEIRHSFTKQIQTTFGNGLNVFQNGYREAFTLRSLKSNFQSVFRHSGGNSQRQHSKS